MIKTALIGAALFAALSAPSLASQTWTSENSTPAELKCHIASQIHDRPNEAVYCPTASSEYLDLAAHATTSKYHDGSLILAADYLMWSADGWKEISPTRSIEALHDALGILDQVNDQSITKTWRKIITVHLADQEGN